jgi:hypothetical protein
MNVPDAVLLALLALADIALLVHLRRVRGRRIRDERMMRGLRLAIQREISAEVFTPTVKPWAMRRAG